MSNVFRHVCTLFVVFGALGTGACQSSLQPSAIPSGKPVQGEQSGQLSARDTFPGLTASALSDGVTDATLVNAGWSCINLAGGLTLCAPPGMGLPPRPPADGEPTYNLTAFVDHKFDHHVKFLRPDLYHGQPCLGGDDWHLFAPLNYYECIIPVP
jgi:hypothetical protein